MYQWKSYNNLYHHGILGMKWGKRNGPPYPLLPGDHSTSEKKAGWRKSLSSNQKRVLKITAMTVAGGAAIYGAMKYSDLHSTAKPAIELGMKFVSTFDEKPQIHTVEKIIINPTKPESFKMVEDYTQELLKRNAKALGL